MKLGYVIIYVPDVATTVEFYKKAFGLESRFVLETGQYAEMETGATALAFAEENFVATSHPFEKNRAEKISAGAEIGCVVEDVAASFAKAVAAGAISVAPPKRKPWGQTVSYVRDCNGFLVEICDQVKA